jgi:alkaline phosphatase D
MTAMSEWAEREPWTRRRFLAAVVAAAAASACSGAEDGAGPGPGDDEAGDGTTTAGPDPAGLPVPDLAASPFTLGVASGDPLPQAVILWTRLAPEPTNGGGMPAVDVPVTWEVARTDDFTELVAEGVAVARPTLAHSVHVDVDGLEPDTWYSYRFRVGEHVSSIGRTRTAPGPGTTPDQLRFAVASCQQWQDGYWTAYPHLASDELDAVLFLGDYIYEGDVDADAVRPHNSPEVVTLADYRDRYALYKSDAGLQGAHAAAPWIVTWDDHEVDNNYAGLAPEEGAPVGPDAFTDRRAAAYQAWYEHHPVRVEPPDGPDLVIYRSFTWGDLVDLFVLDTRQYRTDQGCGDAVADLRPACDDIDQADRTMLGSQQERWLLEGLGTSEARWRVIANQVVFGNVMLGEAVINYDQWDGYPASRRRLLEAIVDREVENLVVLTGDIHFGACGNLRMDQTDPESPILATEFVGTSISSRFDEELLPFVAAFADVFPDVLYSNGERRGYLRCTVTPERWTTEYVVVDTIDQEVSDASVDATFEIAAGTPGANPVG